MLISCSESDKDTFVKIIPKESVLDTDKSDADFTDTQESICRSIMNTETTVDDTDEYNYVLNTSTKKFHYPSCKSVTGKNPIAEHNKAFHTGTRDELISMGYSPCGNCDP